MILPLRVFGRSARKLDLLRRHRGAEPLPAEADELEPQLVARLVARVQDHERLDDGTDDRVGFADHTGLGDRGMLHERALDLERADEMPGRLDDVVAAADEPEVAVGVAAGEVAAQVPAAAEALPVALRLAEVAAEHRRPARRAGASSPSSSALALLGDTVAHDDLAVFVPAQDRGVDARQRPSHRTGLDVGRAR